LPELSDVKLRKHRVHDFENDLAAGLDNLRGKVNELEAKSIRIAGDW